MPYLIDGHNLIPHIPGMTLNDLDDEQALIELLQGFARQARTRVEVFFDRAPPAKAGSRSFGVVKAHFIREGRTADQAIVSRLQRIKKQAKNWTVVTNDREILAEAKSIASKTLSSRAFASLLTSSNLFSEGEGEKGENPEVTQAEMDYWLDQFNGG